LNSLVDIVLKEPRLPSFVIKGKGCEPVTNIAIPF